MGKKHTFTFATKPHSFLRMNWAYLNHQYFRTKEFRFIRSLTYAESFLKVWYEGVCIFPMLSICRCGRAESVDRRRYHAPEIFSHSV